MLDQVLWIVEIDQKDICLYLLADNLNTDKPVDIQKTEYKWIVAYRWKTGIKLFVNSRKYS